MGVWLTSNRVSYLLLKSSTNIENYLCSIINPYMRTINQYTGALIFLLVLSCMGFGFLLPMSNDGHFHCAQCPFEPGNPSMCIMTPFEHISAWQHMFVGVMSQVLEILALFCLFFWLSAYSFAPPIRKLCFGCQLKIDTPTLYQILFARGILNPKKP